MKQTEGGRGKEEGEGGVFFFFSGGGGMKAEKGVGFNDEPEELQGIRGYPGWAARKAV